MPIDEGLNRLFSLKTSIKPEDITESEWSDRVELPFLRENGQYLRQFKAWRSQLITVLDGCKIAFLAIRFLNGSISYDTSTWGDVRSEAQRLKRSCLVKPHSGGNLVVGKFVEHTKELYGLPSSVQGSTLGLP